MTDPFDEDTMDVIKRLRDKKWRMSHLYKIRDKDGIIVRFRPNEAQKYLYENRHRRNIIPKARQRGISTGILIDYLDDCLFTPNIRAATLAHREADAIKLFESKVKFPYESIDPRLMRYIPSLESSTTFKMKFSNGSTISAETMVRSDTLQRLHVSELAKLYRQQPARAAEVQTGAFPAAERGIIDIESTMEGRFGLMYDLCEKAKEIFDLKTPLTVKDFKFFFFAWWGCTDYVLDTEVGIPSEMEEYFEELETNEKIFLTDQQKWWYVKESEIQLENMKQEYPATYRESTEVANEGMFFGKNIVRARKESRIGSVPYDSHSDVFAAMDIGKSDSTAIWVFQLIGKERHFIDYYERDGEEVDFFVKWLRERPYSVRSLGLPFDADSEVLGLSKSVANQFRSYGFPVKVLDRNKLELHGINDARSAFVQCWFDNNKCKRGLKCLDNFRKEWDDKHGCYRTKSVHDEFSDGAKGFIYAIQYGDYLKGTKNSLSKKDYRKLKKRNRRII